MGRRMMGLMLLHCYFSLAVLCGSSDGHVNVSRSDFPKGFIFGTASSAFQYEGAAREDGRGPSIWDTLTLQHKNSIADGSNAIVADDQYHRYKEDINLMSDMGMDAYRFSISWPRILPKGRGSVNQLGVDYYNNLINGLLEKGIQPFVTLYHWDLPQSLQDAYGGWLNSLIIDDYTNFVNVCFREFGDRVKHWITFNEPDIFVPFGYNNGTFAPQRCSRYIGDCKSGNSAIEPYIVGHNVLLSHASIVDLYRKEYQARQQGSIGITQNSFWYVALHNSPQDSLAVQRILDFTMGWFVDPIVFGDYPTSMRDRVGDRLPQFTEAQKKKLKNSIDFIGINYYASNYAYAAFSPSNLTEKDYYSDMSVLTTGQRDGVLIGPLAGSPVFNIVPFGLYDLMMYVKDKYKNIPIYITESGLGEASNSSIPLKEALQDPIRVQYYNDHLTYLSQSIKYTLEGQVSIGRGYAVEYTLEGQVSIGRGYTVEPHSRSQSCPFCRDSLKRVDSRDLWVLTELCKVQDTIAWTKDNQRRLFMYIEKLSLLVSEILI